MIKHLRLANGLSQKELAEEVGVSTSSISRIEKYPEKLGRMGSSIIVNLSRALRVSSDVLIYLYKLDKKERDVPAVTDTTHETKLSV